MTSFLNRLFGRSKRGSGATAKDRLRFVLQHDRINLPPERAEEMKKEILAVIVKYLAVDQERVEIALEQRDRTHSKLVAEIPIVGEPKQAPKAAVPAPAKAEPNGQLKAEASTDNDDDDDDAAESEAEDDKTSAKRAKNETETEEPQKSAKA